MLRTQFARDVRYNTVHKLIRYRLGAKPKRARRCCEKWRNGPE